MTNYLVCALPLIPVHSLHPSDVPEEPYIQFNGQRLGEHSPITVRENTEISLSCVVRGASPPVRHIFWYLSHENITHTSKLLMEYSAEEDISLAISVIKLNATQEYHKKLIICQVYHVSWLNPATVSASFNILCKYDLQMQNIVCQIGSEVIHHFIISLLE